MKHDLAFSAILALIMFVAIPPAFGSSQAFGAPNGVLAVSQSGTPDAKVFTVIVSHLGFNGSSGPLAIQATQGDNITINFVYGEGNLSFDNPHIIKIEGYNIQTRVLDKSAPMQRLSLIVGQAGRFVFHCVLPCFGMENLQNGVVEVAPSPTTVKVSTGLAIRHMELHPPLHLHVIGVVTDSNNNPVRGVPVDFYLETSFGYMKIGSNVTQADGSAHLLYPLFFCTAISCTPSLKELNVRVSFGGGGNFKPSNGTATLVPNYPALKANETTPYLSLQTPLVDLRLIGVPPIPAYAIVLLGLVVIAGVWSVYFFVLTQIIGIRRVAKKEGKN